MFCYWPVYCTLLVALVERATTKKGNVHELNQGSAGQKRNFFYVILKNIFSDNFFEQIKKIGDRLSIKDKTKTFFLRILTYLNKLKKKTNAARSLPTPDISHRSNLIFVVHYY